MASDFGEVSADGNVKTIEGAIVGYFSLDLSAERLATKIIAAQTAVPIDSITHGNIGQSEFDRIATVSLEIETLPLYIDDTGTLSSALVAARARRLKRRRGLDLLIIDNISGLQSSYQATAGDEQEFTSVAESLKSLAQELNIPIVLVVQAQTPTTLQSLNLASLQELGPLEKYADLILVISRKELVTSQTSITDSQRTWINQIRSVNEIAELVIAKNRGGPAGSVTVEFSPSTGLFRDLPRS